jgi:hypothetical protein
MNAPPIDRAGIVPHDSHDASLSADRRMTK